MVPIELADVDSVITELTSVLKVVGSGSAGLGLELSIVKEGMLAETRGGLEGLAMMKGVPSEELGSISGDWNELDEVGVAMVGWMESAFDDELVVWVAKGVVIGSRVVGSATVETGTGGE